MSIHQIFWTIGEHKAAWLDDFSDQVAFLSPKERELYQMLRFPKRRMEWILSRLTAKMLFQKTIQIHPSTSLNDIQIVNEPSGKPAIQVINRDLQDIQLSISHRDHFAFCAITYHPGIRVGADIELVEKRFSGFVDDYFTSREVNVIKESSPGSQDLIVTIMWSMKEAILKSTGEGLRVDTRQIEIEHIDGLDLLEFREATDWRAVQANYKKHDGNRFLCWWRLFKQYVLTLALYEQGMASISDHEVQIKQVDIDNIQ